MASRSTGASLVDAALGHTCHAAPPEQASDSPPAVVWGSIERNTGTWTPYSAQENAQIEAAFQNPAVADVEVPTCFNAVVHFAREAGAHHHQLTPAVGTKPVGFRSVLRGHVGQAVTLHWWEDQRRWQLEVPDASVQARVLTQEVTVEPPMAGPEAFTWQWCDLIGQAVADAREINWHPYAPDHGARIEAAWSTSIELQLDIGLTSYRIGGWQGTYGQQTNLTTGAVRQVRRGRFTVLTTTPADYAEESCALCTESFADTPEWPIRRTPCRHAFHWTCLQHLLRQRQGQLRCPMCRSSLAGMTPGGSQGGQSWMDEDDNLWARMRQ